MNNSAASFYLNILNSTTLQPLLIVLGTKYES